MHWNIFSNNNSSAAASPIKSVLKWIIMPYFIGFCFSLPISMDYLAPLTPLQENKPKPLLLNCYPCFLFWSYFCATIMSTNTQYEKNSSPVQPSVVCFEQLVQLLRMCKRCQAQLKKKKRQRENLRVKGHTGKSEGRSRIF